MEINQGDLIEVDQTRGISRFGVDGSIEGKFLALVYKVYSDTVYCKDVKARSHWVSREDIVAVNGEEI